MEKQIERVNREEKLEKARNKKKIFLEKEEIKNKTRKITEMLEKIPKVEADRIENEMKRKEIWNLPKSGRIFGRCGGGRAGLWTRSQQYQRKLTKLMRSYRR